MILKVILNTSTKWQRQQLLGVPPWRKIKMCVTATAQTLKTNCIILFSFLIYWCSKFKKIYIIFFKFTIQLFFDPRILANVEYKKRWNKKRNELHLNFSFKYLGVKENAKLWMHSAETCAREMLSFNADFVENFLSTLFIKGIPGLKRLFSSVCEHIVRILTLFEKETPILSFLLLSKLITESQWIWMSRFIFADILITFLLSVWLVQIRSKK